jgi:hypothetical protein
MTRETKAGLIVSGSFLCLVGVVLASKLNEPDPAAVVATNPDTGLGAEEPVEVSPEEKEPEATAGPQGLAQPQGKDHSPNATNAQAVQPASFVLPGPARTLPQPGTLPRPQVKGEKESAAQTPNLPRQNDQRSQQAASEGARATPIVDNQAVGDPFDINDAEKAKQTLNQGGRSAQIVIENRNQRSTQAPALPNLNRQEVQPRAATLLKKDEEKPKDQVSTTTNGAVKFSTLNQGTNSGGSNQGKEPATPFQAPKIVAVPVNSQPRIGTDSKTDPKKEDNAQLPFRMPPPPPSAVDVASNDPVLKLGQAPKENPKPAAVQVAPLPALGQPNTGATTSTGTASPNPDFAQASADRSPSTARLNVTSTQPASPSFNQPQNNATTPNLAPLGEPAARSAESTGNAKPAQPVRGGPSEPLGAPESENTREKTPPNTARLGAPALPPPNQFTQASQVAEPGPNRATTPVGATLPAVSRPISAPLPAAAPRTGNPKVESYDEDEYTLGPDDTLRSISQAKYQSDRYEQALLLFNRDHWGAAAGLQADPPRLQPGTKIYVPEPRILEKYFGSPVADAAEPARTTAAAPPPRPTLTMPSLAAEAGEPASVIRPVAVVSTQPKLAPPPEKTYRVAEGGEAIWSIAERTLGNGERWMEIYSLNKQSFDPGKPVPAGTMLKLPGDASSNAARTP